MLVIFTRSGYQAYSSRERIGPSAPHPQCAADRSRGPGRAACAGDLGEHHAIDKSFTAVVLGGFGSLPGAIAGGVLLGVAENLAAGYVGANLQTAATFLLLIFVLAIRPTGLFGRPLQRRV